MLFAGHVLYPIAYGFAIGESVVYESVVYEQQCVEKRGAEDLERGLWVWV